MDSFVDLLIMPVTTGPVCVSVIQEEKIFEWKINDFLQLTDLVVYSPEFCFSDASWRIAIFPFIDCEYIGLDLSPVSLPNPLTVNVTLGFKTVNEKSDLEDTSTKFIDKKDNGFHRPKVISRLDLIRRKSELLPSDTLTVICTLKNIGSNVVNEHKFLDATTQTEERTENKFLDATEKTEERKTGVSVLQQQFKEILQTGNVSDVVMKVAGQEFKSHRCVLAARSPVFLAMLTHDTKEKNTGVVDIKDADPKMFPDFLHYLYTGSEEIITSDNVVELFTDADKYQVDELKKSCLHFMLKNISVDNFCDLLSLSLEHTEKDLTDACSRFFIENSLPILKTSKWLMFATKNLVAANELTIKYVEKTLK